MKCYFNKITRMVYKNKTFDVFINKNNKYAFLEVKNGEKYFYPQFIDVIELVTIFCKSTDALSIKIGYGRKRKRKKAKVYSFIPKVIYKGAVLVLSTFLLTSCGPRHNNNVLDNKVSNSNNSYESDYALEENTNDTLEIIEESTEDVEQKYLNLLAAADDEYDFLYASDFYRSDMTKNITVRDAKNYDIIYGYSDVSTAMIEEACERNSNIPREYKEFIVNYVKDWLRLYPGTNFSTLYHNLETLKINIVSKEGMMRATVSMDSVACYKKSENAIYVLDSIDLSKEGDDYIILAHELSHCGRNAKFKTSDNYTVRVSFIDSTEMGYYSEEALITDFVYALQGEGKKSNFYTLQSSYFRIILDCIDYDGADFMNHSVNYLIDKMNEFMEDEQYAHHIIALIDAEASLRYTDYKEVDFYDFTELYQYITRMYMKKHLNENMSYQEAADVYDRLIEEITYYFDQMKEPYEIDFSIFEEEFHNYLDELGIKQAYSL